MWEIYEHRRVAGRVKQLLDFVDEEGYNIIGAHEEEYLKGPTMFSKGNPEEYVTIIRYRAEKSVLP